MLAAKALCGKGIPESLPVYAEEYTRELRLRDPCGTALGIPYKESLTVGAVRPITPGDEGGIPSAKHNWLPPLFRSLP